MVLVYTHKVTNRIKFIFHLLFKEMLNTEVQITSNEADFFAYEAIKFNYSKHQLGDELFFCSDNLLFERGIRHIDMNVVEFENLPALFPVYNKDSAFPFDPFAASFYLVSRYEEYLPYRKDEYGRFPANESIAFQKGFLQKPLVNIWALKIAEKISQKFSAFTHKPNKYRYLPTIDIDAAWAYRQKGLFRTVGGFAGALFRQDFEDIKLRMKVLTKMKEDPFDIYGYLFEIQKRYKLSPIYFILFAEYGFNDKNITVTNRNFQTLVKSIADYAEVGIHPSYNSNDYPKKLKKEISRLSKVLNREITKSRQHFLKIQLPTTYRNLINLDILDDYSMGFAAQPGFRASICSPFNFYDLDLDFETKLRIHPFSIMDGTLRDYLNLGTEEALEQISQLIDEVKAVKGTFISLWHNESLGETKRWTGWRGVYEEMTRKALP
ncbi:MAG: polysaccharide deacetylase family protein [Bacteroidales bacterium]|nr:polysaccharide deacetylase family protein [Bacteroidales bacterium]